MRLFQHIRFIEQPLTRALTLDPKTKRAVARVSDTIPLIIDEADGTLTAFKEAHALGYSGVSHKNCKGFFKSLLNHGLCKIFADAGQWTFLSGEDLSNMPIVPLHQDFAALGVLGETDRAAAIWAEAQTVFADRPDALATVRAAAEQAGVAQ